jgi:hypothetical protein
MSTILLSLLLLFLIAVGLLMGRQVAERFENPTTTTPTTVPASPALANLLATPAIAAAIADKPAPAVDKLARDKEIQEAAACPKCPACPPQPDMSRYIHVDEIPCWNCDVASTFREVP